MKRRGLRALIRLHRFELDQKRRQIADAEAARADIVAKRQNLLNEVERERAIAIELSEMLPMYGPYAQEAVRRRGRMDEQIAAAEQVVLARQEEARESFREVKKYELTDARLAKLAAEEEARRDRIELDEIALNMHRLKDTSEQG